MALVGLLVLLKHCRIVFVFILAWYRMFVMNDKLDTFFTILVMFHPICILQNMSLSVNDLLACCGFLCGSGCEGGYPLYAWRYLMHHGVVSEEVISFFHPTTIII